jgi:hypothetical protein
MEMMWRALPRKVQTTIIMRPRMPRCHYARFTVVFPSISKIDGRPIENLNRVGKINASVVQSFVPLGGIKADLHAN